MTSKPGLPNGENRSILVVDDDEAVRYLCAQALKHYRILEAGNGKEALRILTREPVDVVLACFPSAKVGVGSQLS